jgi:DNA polymerase III subunit beta
MKTSFLSEKLQEKLPFVSHAISTRTQLPILLNFLIKAEKGSLSISATDLEIGIKIDVPAKTEEEGEVAIPGKTFLELVSVLPAEKIIIETTKEGLRLSGGKIKTVFQTAPAGDFPKLYDKKGSKSPILSKETISEDLQKVVFAASQDLTRPALSGVLIKKNTGKQGELLIVATDGYRLSLKKHNLNKNPTDEVSLIIPSKVIKELMLMNRGGEDVEAYVSEENNQIIFSQENTTLVGRLIEAEFPAFEKIIPDDFSTKTIFDKDDLEKAVKACYIFARNAANIIKLSIKKEKIIASSATPSVGENTIELDAKTTGEENEIAFNARYLLDLLSNIEEETMSFEMAGPLNPGVFKIVGDESFLHLIMPIRVQQETQ